MGLFKLVLKTPGENCSKEMEEKKRPRPFLLPPSPRELFSEILCTLLQHQYLRVKDALTCRLVSKTSQKIITSSPLFLNQVSYIISGSDLQSFEILQQMTTNPEIQIRSLFIKDLETELNFLELKYIFEYVSSRLAPHITSLTLLRCKIRMGRLIELLSFCINLRHFSVQGCPTMYYSPAEVIHWERFFRHFHHSMYHLSHLSLVETQSGCLNREEVMSLILLTSSLTSLKIHTGFVNLEKNEEFPKNTISKSIQQSRKTLRDLDIMTRSVGIKKSKSISKGGQNQNPSQDQNQSLWMLLSKDSDGCYDELRSLRVSWMDVSELPFFASIATKLTSLELKSVGEVKLSEILNWVPQLRKLRVEECQLFRGGLGLRKLKQLRQLEFINNSLSANGNRDADVDSDTDADRDTSPDDVDADDDTDVDDDISTSTIMQEYINAMVNGSANIDANARNFQGFVPLREILIEIADPGIPIGDHFQVLLEAFGTGSLRKLGLRNFKAFSEDSFVGLGKSGGNLEELDLSQCDIQSSHIIGENGESPLVGLKELRSLNLSETNVSDLIFESVALHLPKIRDLIMENTNVDVENAPMILSIFGKHIENLRMSNKQEEVAISNTDLNPGPDRDPNEMEIDNFNSVAALDIGESGNSGESEKIPENVEINDEEIEIDFIDSDFY